MTILLFGLGIAAGVFIAHIIGPGTHRNKPMCNCRSAYFNRTYRP